MIGTQTIISENFWVKYNLLDLFHDVWCAPAKAGAGGVEPLTRTALVGKPFDGSVAGNAHLHAEPTVHEPHH